MVRSEDQEEELLSSIIVTGLSKKGSNVGEKVLVGGGNGVLTLWERGVWDDQDERITVDRAKRKEGAESLDALALLPPGVGPFGKIAAVGLGNGDIRFVKLGKNQVIGELKHDELAQEGVIGLDFDVTGRMISGGGKTVKVWGEKGALGTNEDEDEEEELDDDDDVEDEPAAKRLHESDSDKDSDSDMDSSSDEEQQSKRKKRKKNKGKQQKGHGILKFSGLD
jgi:hypothetical protein